MGSIRLSGIRLFGKGRRPVPSGFPVAGIVNHRADVRKITGARRRRWKRQDGASALTLVDAAEAAEEEQLVPEDRAADRSAEAVLRELPLLLPTAAGSNRAPSCAGCSDIRTPSLESVGPGFRLDVDDGAAGHALLGVEAVGHDVHAIDRLERRHDRRPADIPDVRVGRAVNVRGGRRSGGAVHTESDRPGGIAAAHPPGPHAAFRLESRKRLQQALVISGDRHGQILELPGLDLVANLAAVRLQLGRLGPAVTVTVDSTPATFSTASRRTVLFCHDHASGRKSANPDLVNGHGIGARLQVGKTVPMPLSFVRTWRVRLVSVLTTVTSAPGTAAWAASVTFPTSDP